MLPSAAFSGVIQKRHGVPLLVVLPSDEQHSVLVLANDRMALRKKFNLRAHPRIMNHLVCNSTFNVQEFLFLLKLDKVC